jgi:hypothetical protein
VRDILVFTPPTVPRAQEGAVGRSSSLLFFGFQLSHEQRATCTFQKRTQNSLFNSMLLLVLMVQQGSTHCPLVSYCSTGSRLLTCESVCLPSCLADRVPNTANLSTDRFQSFAPKGKWISMWYKCYSIGNAGSEVGGAAKQPATLHNVQQQ